MLNKQQTKVGLFVISGLALIAIAIIVLGGNESYLTKNHPFHSYFTKSDGLIPGAKVVVSGVPAGTVKNIESALSVRVPDEQDGREVHQRCAPDGDIGLFLRKGDGFLAHRRGPPQVGLVAGSFETVLQRDGQVRQDDRSVGESGHGADVGGLERGHRGVKYSVARPSARYRASATFPAATSVGSSSTAVRT